MTTTIEIRPALTAADLDASAIALALSFYDDPIMKWIVPDNDKRADVSPAAFSLFVDAFARFGETYVVGNGLATSLWAPPGGVPLADEDAISAVLGDDAVRMGMLFELFEEHHPEDPCWHLQLLGVSPLAQGQGLGTRLLTSVLNRADANGEPAYLEATSEANRRLYERHGFVVTKELRVADSPTLYAMWREPQR